MNYNLRVPAAERRKNVSHGRKPVDGIVSKSQPRRGARFLESIRIFRPSGAGIQGYCLPRACARGYILTPLRGFKRMPRRVAAAECSPTRQRGVIVNLDLLAPSGA